MPVYSYFLPPTDGYLLLIKKPPATIAKDKLGCWHNALVKPPTIPVSTARIYETSSAHHLSRLERDSTSFQSSLLTPVAVEALSIPPDSCNPIFGFVSPALCHPPHFEVSSYSCPTVASIRTSSVYNWGCRHLLSWNSFFLALPLDSHATSQHVPLNTDHRTRVILTEEERRSYNRIGILFRYIS